MATNKTHDGALGELETLVNNIGVEGADRDDALSTMAKGMSASLTGLVGVLADLAPMAKAAKPGNMGPADTESQGKADDDEDNSDANKAEGDKGRYADDSGYQDMEMGLELDDDGQVVDATVFLSNMGRRVQRLEKGMDRVISLVEQIQRTSKANDAKVAAALTEGFSVLAKGVVETRSILDNVPAAAITGDQTAAIGRLVKGKGHAKYVSDDASAQAESGLTPQQMLKGINRSLITEDHMRNWKRTGKLSDDSAENERLVERVRNAG